MSAKLQIGGIDILPSSQRLVELRLPLLYTHTPVVLSAQVMRGRRDGPCLFVCAAVHGDEINGVEIVRRLRQAPALARLRGTLILVPVVNVYGFVRQSRYLPDRRDLNRCSPGSEKGSLAARLANAFLEEIVAKADFGIDLHTGAVHRENLPQIRASFDDSGRVEGLAKAFGSPVILNADLRDGSLREAAANLGVPVLVYEGGEALRFSELAIGAGVRGVLGVLRALGMLGGAKRSSRFGPGQPEPVIATSSQWVRAPQSGILRVPQPLGTRVEKGGHLGWIADPLGDNDIAVESPTAGIIIGKVNLPLVNEGEALYHIARFGEPDMAAEAVERFQNAVGPESDAVPLLEPPPN